MSVIECRERHYVEDLVLWRHGLEGVNHTTLPPRSPRPNPLVLGDLVIASVFSPGGVHANDRTDGRPRWLHPMDGFAGSPLIYVDSTLYSQSIHTLNAIDPVAGQVRWTFCPYGTEHEWIYSSPTISDGRLFLGDRAGYLSCLDADSGRVIWRKLTSRFRKRQVNATAVVADDLVITATTVNSAVAYEAKTGERVWRRRLDGYSSGELRSWKGGVLIQTPRSLYLLSPRDGTVLHRWHWRGREVKAFDVAGDSLIVVTAQAGTNAASKIGTSNQEVKIVCLKEDTPLFESLTSRFLWGIRYSLETRLIYEARIDGFGILDPVAGERLHDIRSKDGPLLPSLGDVKGSTIYLLAQDKNMYALRHP